MFGSRRLAKRSIIGSRVCVPLSDGWYRPGQIQSTQTWPNGEEVFMVLMEDGSSRVFRDIDIIGPGFQPISVARLKAGQRVFITHQGREVKGVVLNHFCDEVSIELEGSVPVKRRLEEVRLLESRRSARLQDQGDQDYSRLADVHSTVAQPELNGKKRAVSHVIDVPTPAPKQRRGKLSHSPSPEPPGFQEKMDVGDCRGSPCDIMDEHAAAMVLTSLSCSPQSPPMFPFGEKGGSPFGACSSVGSSGVWGMKGEPGTPSPPRCTLSQSAPSVPIFGPVDEGIDMDDLDEDPKRRRMSTKTVFKCTWPGCGKISNACSAMEHHVRSEHLQGKESSDSETSDHEEEFYYTEIEVSVDTVTRTFADMYTSSPTNPMDLDASGSNQGNIPDHDYQKKSSPQSIPWTLSEAPETEQFPASFPSVSAPLSWSGQQGPRIAKSAERLTGSKSSSHKKSRSEVKKCRKVYGMENRDMWCTQCKWKKACSRFLD